MSIVKATTLPTPSPFGLKMLGFMWDRINTADKQRPSGKLPLVVDPCEGTILGGGPLPGSHCWCCIPATQAPLVMHPCEGTTAGGPSLRGSHRWWCILATEALLVMHPCERATVGGPSLRRSRHWWCILAKQAPLVMFPCEGTTVAGGSLRGSHRLPRRGPPSWWLQNGSSPSEKVTGVLCAA